MTIAKNTFIDHKFTHAIIKRKFKLWWSMRPTNINKTNNHLSP